MTADAEEHPDAITVVGGPRTLFSATYHGHFSNKVCVSWLIYERVWLHGREGIRWVRGRHTPDSPTGLALLAAHALASGSP